MKKGLGLRVLAGVVKGGVKTYQWGGGKMYHRDQFWGEMSVWKWQRDIRWSLGGVLEPAIAVCSG